MYLIDTLFSLKLLYLYS